MRTQGHEKRRFAGWLGDGTALVAVGSVLFTLFIAECTVRLYFFISRGSGSAIQFLEPSDDPQISYKLRRSHNGKIRGFEAQTNEEGFRDASWRNGARSQDTKRILVVGDSVPFGWLVKQDETFPAVLEKQLRAESKDVRVFNASVPGYGIEQHLRLMDLYGARLDPDLVLIAYCLNDPDPVGGTEAHAFFHPPLFEAWNLLKRVRARMEIAWTGGDYHVYVHEKFADRLEAYFERLGEYRATGTQIAIFIVPAFTWSDSVYPYTAIHRKLRSLARANGIAVIDAAETLIRYPTNQVAVDGWHPNATGHDLLATVLKGSSVVSQLFESGADIDEPPRQTTRASEDGCGGDSPACPPAEMHHATAR